MYLHYKEKIDSKTILLISLLLLSFYGSYKNGLVYYYNGIYSLKEAIYPLLISLLSFIPVIIEIIKAKKIKNSLLIPITILTLPVNTNIYYVIAMIIIMTILINKTTFPFFYLLSTYFILTNDFNNPIEQQPIFYHTVDTFFGKSIGALGTTNIFLLIIIYLILQTRFYYKKEIPLITIITYSLLTLIVDIINHDGHVFLHILNSSVFYTSIICLPWNNYTPYEKTLLYAFITGILFYLSTYLDFLKGPFYVLTIMTIFIYIQKKLCRKNQNQLQKEKNKL